MSEICRSPFPVPRSTFLKNAEPGTRTRNVERGTWNVERRSNYLVVKYAPTSMRAAPTP
jgi:hypothetical protein